ncbi:hypothetical protein JYU34_006873 [Plutella xylostella]|uniref:Zinc finger PHD-type domain-containing protein n=1 Tax=Plutella xylostella TaxID=51655 RepID=A0ABQ7QT58_PLUXY|nr:hypothetical protein JYU34_006873 [Plutella xylostella]
MKCNRCDEVVGDCAVCSICRGSFHFHCGGIQEVGYKRLGERKSQWRCQTCREGSTSSAIDPVNKVSPLPAAAPPAGLPSPDNTNVSARGDGEGDVVSTNVCLSRILQQLAAMDKKLCRLDELNSNVNTVRSDILELQTSLNFHTAKFEEFTKKVTKLESKVAQVSKDSEVQQKSITTIIDDLNRNDQWVRRHNVEIQEVPESKDENLLTIFKKLVHLAGLPYDASTELDFISRVAHMNADNSKPRCIILRFVSRYKKDEFVVALRKLRLTATDLGFANKMTLHFNDHLTPKNRLLLRQVKKMQLTLIINTFGSEIVA